MNFFFFDEMESIANVMSAMSYIFFIIFIYKKKKEKGIVNQNYLPA